MDLSERCTGIRVGKEGTFWDGQFSTEISKTCRAWGGVETWDAAEVSEGSTWWTVA